jgi:hypothetical protein
VNKLERLPKKPVLNLVSNVEDLTKICKQKKETENINSKKQRAWKEFVATLKWNPWGKPYRSIINKLKNKKPIVNLNSNKINSIINTLFTSNN